MKKFYSRRIAVEEKNNIKRSVTFIILSLVVLISLFFFGIPLMARFVSFISDLKKKDIPISINDNTPPAPPRFDVLPDATNKEIIDVSGETEEGATVFVYLNNLKNETLADSDGLFTFSANLKKGENIIYAISQDKSGNKSAESKKYTIIFDNEKPEININSPSDGETFYGEDQKEIEISGSTKPDIELNVNDRFITLDVNGNFKYKYLLSEGENELNFKALDKAGNQSEKRITVNFIP